MTRTTVHQDDQRTMSPPSVEEPRRRHTLRPTVYIASVSAATATAPAVVVTGSVLVAVATSVSMLAAVVRGRPEYGRNGPLGISRCWYRGDQVPVERGPVSVAHVMLVIVSLGCVGGVDRSHRLSAVLADGVGGGAGRGVHAVRRGG